MVIAINSYYYYLSVIGQKKVIALPVVTNKSVEMMSRIIAVITLIFKLLEQFNIVISYDTPYLMILLIAELLA